MKKIVCSLVCLGISVSNAIQLDKCAFDHLSSPFDDNAHPLGACITTGSDCDISHHDCIYSPACDNPNDHLFVQSDDGSKSWILSLFPDTPD